jgi:RNA polymerase sigma-70 factor (ECF subfamily)
MNSEQEFELFVTQHQNTVFSTAMRLLVNEADAQDIAQEVFLRAYKSFAELSRSPTVVPWLRKVATNLSLNHLSRYRRRWSLFSELFNENGSEAFVNDLAGPGDLEEEITSAEEQREVAQALQNLPTPQRVPLVLFHLEGLTYQGIADKLGVSMGKVKTDIFRARQRLRTILSSRSPGLRHSPRDPRAFNAICASV